MRQSIAVLGVALGLVLTGCGDQAGDSVVTASTATPPTTEAPTTGESTATSEPAATAVVTSITLSGGDSITVDGGEVWVGSSSGNWVRVFEASTGDQAASILDVCERNSRPKVHTITDDRVWATCNNGTGKGTLVVIDRAGRAVEGTVDIGAAATSLAFVDGIVWVTDPGRGAVVRVDPEALKVSGATPVGDGCDRPGQAQLAEGSIWIAGPTASSCGGVTRYTQTRIHEIDVATHEIVWSSSPMPGATVEMAVAGGEIWATGDGDVLTILDATSKRVLGEVGPDLGRSTGRDTPLLRAGTRFIWVLNRASGGDPAEIVIVDRGGRSVVERIKLAEPTAFWIDGDTAWVAYRDGVAHISPAG